MWNNLSFSKANISLNHSIRLFLGFNLTLLKILVLFNFHRSSLHTIWKSLANFSIMWEGPWDHQPPVFNREILKKYPNKNHRIPESGNLENLQLPTTKALTLTILTLEWETLRIYEACQKLVNHSPTWGLHWNILVGLTWHILSERNRRLRQQTLRPPELLLQEIIMNSSLSFRVEIFKKSYGSQLEEITRQV